MSLQRLLAEGRLRRHRTSASEILGLLSVADRDLRDARVDAVSLDRRFATAYNAALQLATIPLHAEGFRTAGTAHHQTTIATVPLIVGPDLQGTADYLDACRSKRNSADYDRIGVATERDVSELIEEAQELREKVLVWLEAHHPRLAP
jgi:hypothetical protein